MPVGAEVGAAMARVIVDSLISLDGYFAGPHDEIDWFVSDEESLEWSRKILRRAGAVLFGRVTYEGMASYWPGTEDADPFVRQRLNELPKIVFSSTLSKPSWANSVVERDDPSRAVARLKRRPGKALVVLGSSNLVSALARDGLVDEYRIRVQPVVLGAGRPLFIDQERRSHLKLVSAEPFKSGVVGLHYEPAEPLPSKAL